jgi:ABC-type transporter Mla subunit MlaD
MGEKQVDILLGSSSQALRPGESISGRYQPDFGQVISQMGELGDALRSTFLAAGGLLSDTTSGSLRETLAEVGGSAAQIRQLLDRNAKQLDQTIEHLHTFSANMARIRSGQNPEELIPNMERASQDLAETARRLRSLSDSLESLLGPTLSGQSTFGKLLSDDALYRSCQNLVAHLDSLVQDIHRDPQRYFKVEVF